jgi:hypothetical protein
LDNPNPPGNTITIPLDSLKFAIDFQNGFGLGKSVYNTTAIPSLYCNGMANGDTLLTFLNVTDSSSFGFIYFGATGYTRTPARFFVDSSFTIIIKFQQLTSGSRVILSFGNSTNDYIVTGSSAFDQTDYGTGGGINYYSTWGCQRDDSVTAITSGITNVSKANLYRNGVLRVSSIGNLSAHSNGASKTFTIGAYYNGSLGFYGRFFYLYFYNRILTPTEIAKFY